MGEPGGTFLDDAVHQWADESVLELQCRLAAMHDGTQRFGGYLWHHHTYYGTEHGVGEQTVICCG